VSLSEFVGREKNSFEGNFDVALIFAELELIGAKVFIIRVVGVSGAGDVFQFEDGCKHDAIQRCCI
jgi:hypothetical protein